MGPGYVSHQAEPGEHWDDEHWAHGDQAALRGDVRHLQRCQHQPHEARHLQDHGQQEHGKLNHRAVWETVQGEENKMFCEVGVTLQNGCFNVYAISILGLPWDYHVQKFVIFLLSVLLPSGWSSSRKRWLRYRLCWNAQPWWTQSCDKARC